VHGERACARYWKIFEELRGVRGYADCLLSADLTKL
jgi:hypothetical protein